MAQASKLRSAPNLQAFIEGAERPAEPAPKPAPAAPTPQPEPQAQAKPAPERPKPKPPARKPLPWEEERVREDVIKPFNLRLPEPLMLKLRYIADHSPDSMQSFCLRSLRPAIDRRAREISDGQP